MSERELEMGKLLGERIARALYELDMQKTRDNYCPTAIRRILEGGTA